MSLTQTQSDFLHILRAVFSGDPLSDAISPSDWFPIFRLAEVQQLLPQVYDAVRGRLPSGVAAFDELRRTVSHRVAGHIANSDDWRRIYEALRREGLRPALVKGMLCAELYPVASYRVTADLDLLVDPAEFDACHSVLSRLGLRPKCSEEARAVEYEVGYFSEDRSVCIEVHRSPFPQDEEALNGLFSDALDSLQEHNGLLTLDPGKHLLFLVLHAYKHFIYSGVGVRQVCDIGLWARRYGAEVDWQRLFDCCAKVNAEVFAACLFRIAREYIGLQFALPEYWRDAAIDCEPMLLDMLDGGIYGSESLTRLHSGTATFNAVKANRKGNHGQSILRSVFPERKVLAERYPYLKKHPILLPAAWVSRVLRYFSEVSGNDRSSASGSVQLARQRIRLLEDYKIIR